jgi:hypothetical protein
MFSRCKCLSLNPFENDFALKRIESSDFAEASLDLVLLLNSVAFIAGNAFPCLCDVGIANIDLFQEFSGWNEARQSGATEVFERHRPRRP